MDKRFDKSTDLVEESGVSEKINTERLKTLQKVLKKDLEEERAWKENFFRKNRGLLGTHEEIIANRIEFQLEIREEIQDWVTMASKLIISLNTQIKEKNKTIGKCQERYSELWFYSLDKMKEMSRLFGKKKDSLESELTEVNKERDNYKNQLDNHVCSVNCQESFCLDDYQELQEELKKAKQEIELYKEKSKRSETMLRLVEEELESIVGEWNIQEAREQAERKLKEEEQDKESQTKLEANIEVK